ncbi:MAG: hypothetical protein KAH84_00150 [Thiomargarita sp.]|nr:hypothetical protein [Thiomargarita sp.]
MINSPLAIAIPPYFGVSIGENLSFNQEICLSIAKKVLIADNFATVVQYKGGTSVFAAYSKQQP